jgi:SAM-dependent methyltransferase
MRFVDKCPICSNNKFRPYLSTTDYTTTGEIFNIQECLQCSFLVTSPTPEPADLDRYYKSANYISHSTKSTSPIDILYKAARSFTLRWKLNLVNQQTSTTQQRYLLDYGCGTGQFLKKCIDNGWKTNGIEPAEAARQEATRITGMPISSAIKEKHPAHYDIITLWHVLEHIPDLNPTIDTLRHSLKKDGKLIFAVPNPNSWDANHYKSSWAAYDVPRHLWHFSKTNMALLLKKHDLRIQSYVPMKLDSFYISLLSENYKSPAANFKFLRALHNGLKSNLKAIKTREYSSLTYIISK